MRFTAGIMFALSMLFCGQDVCGDVDVCPVTVTKLQSTKYRVLVKQAGKTHDSFVYADMNKFSKKNMTDWNHWTTFSFDGSVMIEVELLAGPIKDCTVYPLQRNVKPSINGNRLSFELDKPAKLFVSMDGQEEDPLFVFADAPEIAPDKSSPNVVWFDPGVHDIGKHYKIENNKIYYLARGSYLKGSFLGENASNVTICGPGILSGENIPHMPYNTHKFEGVGIHFTGRGTNHVEDVTVINPSMYCIRTYWGKLTTSNVKCFGWWYETDGWIGNEGSVLEDSFFKVNDDVVKLYHDNLVVRNLVIYEQMNGAPFQFGWGGESASNGEVEDIDLICCEVRNGNLFQSNCAFINRRIGKPNTVTKNFQFSRIRVDQDISHIIGISTAGTVENILIRDLSIRGKQRWPSYIKGGNVTGITFENVTIGGRKAGKAEIDVQTQGNVSGLSFK